MTFETPEDLAKFVLDTLEASPKSVKIVECNYEDQDLVTLEDLTKIFESKFEVRCPGCGHVIQPDVCCCGEPKNGYHDNHYFTPMGCRCREHE